jgi:putative hydrolase of the HAD superfamily
MTHLSGIRAVFFDAVGTLLFPNPRAVYVYAEAAARHGLAIKPADIGSPLWEQLRQEDARDRELGWATSEYRERERWRAVVTAALPGSTDELFDELFTHFAKPTAWKVPDDAAETLSALQSTDLRLGMGSNYDLRLRTVVDGIPALEPVRDHLVISSLVGVRKPGRGFFDAVVQAAECRPDEILFVGDDLENDYSGATNAGLRAVLLDPKDKYPDVLHRIRRLCELLD